MFHELFIMILLLKLECDCYHNNFLLNINKATTSSNKFIACYVPSRMQYFAKLKTEMTNRVK